MVYVEFHLSADGRDEWSDVIPERDGSERIVRIQSFHLRAPMPIVGINSAAAFRHYRREVVERFVREWFARQMEIAGIED